MVQMKIHALQVLRYQYFSSKPYFWLSLAFIVLGLIFAILKRNPAVRQLWVHLVFFALSTFVLSVFTNIKNDSIFMFYCAQFVFTSGLCLHFLVEPLAHKLARPSRQMLAAVIGTFFLALAVTYLREPHINTQAQRLLPLLRQYIIE